VAIFGGKFYAITLNLLSLYTCISIARKTKNNIISPQTHVEEEKYKGRIGAPTLHNEFSGR
jgi:hypothetical protein